MRKKLKDLAGYISADLHGDAECVITGIGTLQAAKSGQLAFLNNPTYRCYLSKTHAAAVVIAPKDLALCQTNALVVDDPYFAYAKLASLFSKKPVATPGIHPSVIIGKSCQIDPSVSIAANVVIGDEVSIGPRTVIGPGCVIGTDCHIGSDCMIDARVVLYDRTHMGDRVVIHSGAVIGSDGFGFVNKHDTWHGIPQLGGVCIQSDVQIGANTTIDRGAVDDTIIEEGVKIDNQVQVAHNVQIGEHTAIAACVGIAGSAKIGKYCRIGGGVAINGHVEIVDHTALTGTATVSKSIKIPGVYSSGTGLMPNQEWRKNAVRFRNLDKILRKILPNHQGLNKSNTSTGFLQSSLAHPAFDGKKPIVATQNLFDINKVLKNLPQRPPFLFIDAVIKFEPHKSLTAIKNVTINESYFQGHFPRDPVMPGVLILEALAQACTVFAFLTTGEDPSQDEPYYFAGIDHARFKKLVIPGDQLLLHVELVKVRQRLWKMKAQASVNNERVCIAEILSARPKRKIQEN